MQAVQTSRKPVSSSNVYMFPAAAPSEASMLQEQMERSRSPSVCYNVNDKLNISSDIVKLSRLAQDAC